MTAYANLINPNHRHTYALFVYTTGEVYTSSCDEAAYPLRLLYRRLDGLRREWRCDYHLHAALVNLNTGLVIEEIFD
jgi:hypothetical protein